MKRQRTPLGTGRANPQFQVSILGAPMDRFTDVYHRLLKMGWTPILLLAFTVYVAVALAFTWRYGLQPGGVNGVEGADLWGLFHFAVQTLSTIGFGLSDVSSLSRVPRPPAKITAFI